VGVLKKFTMALASLFGAGGVSAALAFLVATAPADANLLFCHEPYEPRIPFGSTADSWEMERAETQVQLYLDDVKTYVECLVAEIKDTNRAADDVLSRWNQQVRLYNLR
jgi:hypothetical protein